MPETKSIVMKYLIHPLAGIVIKYTTAKYRKNFIDIAEVGEYETCLGTWTYIDSYDVFLGGCRGGHVDIMNLGLECKNIKYFEDGCANACYSGHLKIVKLLVSRGAKNIESHMVHACLGGHVDIVKYLISRGFNDWNYGLYYAACGGSREIVDLMISHGALGVSNCMNATCIQRNQEAVQLLVAAGVSKCNGCSLPIEVHV